MLIYVKNDKEEDGDSGVDAVVDRCPGRQINIR